MQEQQMLDAQFAADKNTLGKLFSAYGHDITDRGAWFNISEGPHYPGASTYKLGPNGRDVCFTWARRGNTRLNYDDALRVIVKRRCWCVDRHASDGVTRVQRLGWVCIGKRSGKWVCAVSDIHGSCTPIPHGFYRWLLRHKRLGGELDGTQTEFPKRAMRELIKMFLEQNA